MSELDANRRDHHVKLRRRHVAAARRLALIEGVPIAAVIERAIDAEVAGKARTRRAAQSAATSAPA